MATPSGNSGNRPLVSQEFLSGLLQGLPGGGGDQEKGPSLTDIFDSRCTNFGVFFDFSLNCFVYLFLLQR